MSDSNRGFFRKLNIILTTDPIMKSTDAGKRGNKEETLSKKILSVDKIFELKKISTDSPEDIDKQVEEEMQLQIESSDD